MSTTDEAVTPAGRVKQIRARLAEIAPYPDDASKVTAAGLARFLAMRAQVIWRRSTAPVGSWDRHEIDLMTVLFAASHALRALDGYRANEVAQQIWLAWEDGAGIGGWLWQHLGDEASEEIGALAEELAALEHARTVPGEEPAP